MKIEDNVQSYDIHKTYTGDNSFPLVTLFVDGTDIIHYGLAFHKWKEDAKNSFLCVLDLGTDLTDVKANLLQIDEEMPDSNDIENGNIFNKYTFIFKYYGKIWKPVERNIKKNEWKYKKLPVRNYVSRVLK